MSNDLKPCPFCGGKAESRCTAGPDPDWFVQCAECRASASVFSEDKLDGWNMRALLAKPVDPKPTGLSPGWNLTRKRDGFVVGHQSVAYPPDEKAIERAEHDGYVWVPFLVPAAQHQGEPVAWRVQRITPTGNHRLDRPLLTLATPEEWGPAWKAEPLYTHPTEQPAPISSTSDKHKAELYDEVWQLARDMGFGNVTDALMKLKKQPAPVAVVLPERKSTDNLTFAPETRGFACGWNACLDEVARLNPPQQ